MVTSRAPRLPITGLDIVDAWTQKPRLIRRTNLAYRSRIGAGVGAALGVRIASPAVVAEPRLHRDRNYFDANDAILILSRYFGSLNVVAVNLLPKLGVGVDLVRRGNWLW